MRSPQTLSQSALPSTTNPLSISTPLSVPDSNQPVKDLVFTLGNLSDDILTGMDSDKLLKLVIEARDTIYVVPSPKIQSVDPSNLFSTPQSIPPRAQSNTLSPKMDRVRKITQSGDIMTYTCSLLFLDSHDVFDDIFGHDLTMLNLIPHKRGQCATENTDYLLSKVTEFCNLCRLHIFCDSIQLKYIGTDVYDSQKMLADISLALSKLKMVYTVRGKKISLTPDDLFSNFISFLHLLSPNAMTWSFFWVTLFFQALPAELQDAVQIGGYISPDISQLTTSLLHE